MFCFSINLKLWCVFAAVRMRAPDAMAPNAIYVYYHIFLFIYSQVLLYCTNAWQINFSFIGSGLAACQLHGIYSVCGQSLIDCVYDEFIYIQILSCWQYNSSNPLAISFWISALNGYETDGKIILLCIIWSCADNSIQFNSRILNINTRRLRNNLRLRYLGLSNENYPIDSGWLRAQAFPMPKASKGSRRQIWQNRKCPME